MKNTLQPQYDMFDITKYTPWINLLSKNNNIEIIIDNSFSHTAAINLQDVSKPKIILNPKRMKEKYNYSDEEIMFDIWHELWHLDEEADLQSTQKGKDIAQQRLQRLEAKWNLAESYHTLENVARDIRVNNTLISPQKLPILKNTCYTNYRDKMFQEHDYRNLPKHLQFVYTLIREAMVYDQKCAIAPEIRKVIKRLERSEVLSKAITWSLKERLETIRQYIEPIYANFLTEDIKNQEEKNQEEKNNKNTDNNQNNTKNQEWQNTDQSQQNPQQNNQQQSSENKNQPSSIPSKGAEKGKKSRIKQLMELLSWTTTPENNGSWENANPSHEENLSSQNQEEQGKNPFDELYQNIPQIPHILENELSPEDSEKLKQVIQEYYEEKNKIKTREELELENRVKNMGIDIRDKQKFQETLHQLKSYEQFLKQLSQVKDATTGDTVMEEIEHVFERIKSHRAKSRYISKWPVDIDHGYRLYAWAIASWLAEVQWWNTNPEMFEMDIKREKPEQLTGKFELTIIGDGSWSMEGTKNKQQKIAMLLILEALKRLHDRLSEERKNLKEGVEFQTQALMFMERMEGILHCKDLWSDFSDTERLKSYSTLDYADGWTNDFDGLQEIIDQMKGYSHEHLEEIHSSKTKKIIIVLSDGWSNNENKMKNKIKQLREMWVLVYGIGITSSGQPVVNLFSSTDTSLGFWQVCTQVQNLGQTIKDILWQHLEKL